MKKLFIMIIAMLLPMLASAEDDVEIDGIYYKLKNIDMVAEVISKTYGYKEEVVIPESVRYNDTDYSVTSIGSSAFYNCYGLTSVTIPNSVTSIGEFAFSNCTSLTSITIPNSVTSVGKSAFSGCNSLTSVHISDLEAWCKIDFLNSWSNPLSNAHHLFLNGEEIKDLVIPNSINSIGYGTFYDCSALTSVTIPNNVTSIGIMSFQGCSSLTTIIIPDGVTSIGDYAFAACSALTSVTIPSSVTSIGDHAFQSCNGLISVYISDLEKWCKINSGGESNPFSYAHHLFLNGEEIKELVIPDGVTSIVSYAFRNCSSLISITIPNSVTSIGKNAFQNCSSLTSITFPDGVTSIDSNAFQNCSSLTSITFPDGVTSIGYSAFQNCISLSTIAIGKGVTSIGKNAFGECRKLMSVTSNITEPYSIDSNIFTTDTYRKGTLYIPAGTEKIYSRFDGWREFLNIMEIGSVSNIRGDLNNDGKVDAADVVELINIIMNK